MMHLEHIFLDFGPVSFHLVETDSSDITLKTLHAIAVSKLKSTFTSMVNFKSTSRSEPNA
jgi:hypothetical protein